MQPIKKGANVLGLKVLYEKWLFREWLSWRFSGFDICDTFLRHNWEYFRPFLPFTIRQPFVGSRYFLLLM